MAELKNILAFVRTAGRLKDTPRSAYTACGKQESTAEHSWRLSLLALTLKPNYPDLDFTRVLELCVAHDLGEALHGDIPAVDQDPSCPKATAERDDLVTMLTPLPEADRAYFLGLWEDYEYGRTEEARLVKALDKLETILQHTEGRNPADFDYAFNLEYGRAQTDFDAVTRTLRDLLDAETHRRLEGRDPAEA